VKWLGMFAAAGLILSAVLGDWATRGAVIAGSANYLLFFAGHWATWYRQRNMRVRQTARRAEQVPYAKADVAEWITRSGFGPVKARNLGQAPGQALLRAERTA